MQTVLIFWQVYYYIKRSGKRIRLLPDGMCLLNDVRLATPTISKNDRAIPENQASKCELGDDRDHHCYSSQ